MILVVTGTHEAPFDRLVHMADAFAETSEEAVVIQYGHSSTPQHARGKPFFERDELEEFAEQARVIVTHGGPGSIFLALERGKVPIVVPRVPSLGEHVDNHQVEFLEFLEERGGVVGGHPGDDLGVLIHRWEHRSSTVKPTRTAARQNLDAFVVRLKEITAGLADR